MRRPSPLPSTPSARPAEPEQPVEQEIHLRDDAPATPKHETAPAEHEAAAHETAPIADVVPFAPVESDAAVESDPEQTDPTTEAPERPIGVRDVWAAARARRRALRREIRRFTVRQRRRRLAWLIGLGSVAVVALGAVAAAYSPMFAVSTITVVGTDQLAPAAVEEALAGQLGTPLALIDSSEVKAALVAFPLVETYTLEARPPQELVVRIVERTPIGSIESKAGHTLVDAAGVALATTEEAPEGYPILDIEGGAGSRAFTAAGTIYRSLPADLQAQVSAISATTANDVTLSIEGADVLWGGSDESAEKVAVLSAAMVASPPEEVELYDVSSPGAVVIR